MEEYIKNLKLKKSIQTLDSLINDIQYSCFPKCFNNKKKDKKKLKEYVIIGKKKFINFIGIPDKFDHLFIALDNLPPVMWYKVNSVKDIELITITYLSGDTLSKNRIFRGFLGFEGESNLSYDSLQKFILIHPLTEKVIWGPLYSMPNTDTLSNLSPLDLAINITKLTEQTTEKIKELSFKTKYSKSIITFTEIDKAFFVQIDFSLTMADSTEIKRINDYMKSNFDETLPYDVVAILSNFSKIYTHVDLLSLDPPEVTMSLIVASNIPRYVDELLPFLNNMCEKVYNEKITNDIYNALLTLTINKEFDRIFTEDMLVDNQNLNDLAKKIESQFIYNSHIKKDDVLSYVCHILTSLAT